MYDKSNKHTAICISKTVKSKYANAINELAGMTNTLKTSDCQIVVLDSNIFSRQFRFT